MILKCPNCGRQHRPGTLFCPECGVYLVTGVPLDTQPVPRSELPVSHTDPWASKARPLNVDQGEGTLTVTVVPSDRVIPLTGAAEFVVGKLDATRGVFPDVDLTPDEGVESGVSRRHARILVQRTQFFVEDLGSANGTYLNGFRLTPYLPTALDDGDTLYFGKIMVEVDIDFKNDVQVLPRERKHYIRRGVRRLLALGEQESHYLEATPGGRKSLLKLASIIVGRSGDVVIPDPKVSRQHCRISSEDNEFFIEDLGSTNGTFLNGARLSPAAKRRLNHEDSIQVGKAVLRFYDPIAAFVDELSGTREKEIAIHSIEADHEQNWQIALQMLGKLIQGAIRDSDQDIIGKVALAVREVAKRQPLDGINLLLQVARQKYVHDQVYVALSQLMQQDEGIPWRSLEAIVQRAGDYDWALLYWISIGTEDGLLRSFLEACVTLFSDAGYTETDLERLIGTIGLYKGTEKLVQFYQTLLDLLRIRTVSEISEFRIPDLAERDDFPLTNVVHIVRQLEQISSLTRKSCLVEDIGDKLYYLADALTVLDKIKGEVTTKLREPECAICTEIVSQWHEIVSAEIKDIRGRAVLHSELLTKQLFHTDQVTLVLNLLNTGHALAENVRVTLEMFDDYEIVGAQSHELVGIPAKRSFGMEYTVHPRVDDSMRVAFTIIWDDLEQKHKGQQFTDTIKFVKVGKDFVRTPNPYVVGNPITSPRLFFGREDVFAFVLENLVGTEQKNTLVLHGQRRTGKSSVLLQLRDRVMSQGFIPVYIDMENLPDVKTLDTFLYRLAHEIGRAGRKHNLKFRVPKQFGVQPSMAFDRFMDAAEVALKGRRCVVMLDEFELIEAKIAQGMDAGVLHYFRNLMQHRDSLLFIFAGTHRLQEMTHDYWNILFSIALNREISFLGAEDTRRLIVEPVQGYLEYDDLTIEKIIRVTHCQPYLVQLICWQIVNYLNSQKRNYATINDLNQALDQTLVTAEAYFNSIWEQSTPHQRLALALLTDLECPGKETAALSEVAGRLADAGVNISGRSLIAALSELCHREVLREHSNGELRYSFQIDLVRMWIEKNKPLSRVLIEEES